MPENYYIKVIFKHFNLGIVLQVVPKESILMYLKEEFQSLSERSRWYQKLYLQFHIIGNRSSNLSENILFTREAT